MALETHPSRLVHPSRFPLARELAILALFTVVCLAVGWYAHAYMLRRVPAVILLGC